MFAITSFFAALFGFMLIALSVNVIRTRQTHSVLIGDGGFEKMQRAIRAQANFCEYVPMALLMLALLEAQKTSGFLLFLLGFALLAARASHAYSMIKTEIEKADAPIGERIKFRKIGMIGTFGVLALESLLLLF